MNKKLWFHSVQVFADYYLIVPFKFLSWELKRDVGLFVRGGTILPHTRYQSTQGTGSFLYYYTFFIKNN